MDDTIRSLIRFVARGFYLKQYVLILDAVLIHSVLSEDDLFFLLGVSPKQLRALCYKLVEDRLLATHVQKEEGVSMLRQQNRTYYYIRITAAIDAIKWKVHLLVKQLKDEMSQLGNPHGYLCPRCGKKISQLDAISLLSEDMSNFLCDNCGSALVEDDLSMQASVRQQRLEKLMMQIDPIITYLKKIDDSVVEDNNFESALTVAVPAQATTEANYALNQRTSSKRAAMSSSLRNAASKAQATLNVSITANDENLEREQKEKERVRQKLEQNALPSWHSSSTVGKSLGKVESEEETEVKKEEDQKVVVKDDKDKEAQDVLAAYYADLAEREEEEDDDDDFDDFEDV